MAAWRVQLFGPFQTTADDAEVRLRTVHQRLLVAQLAVRNDQSWPRRDAASTLWPEASHEHSLAYLRRALMEIKSAGFPIASDSERVWIEPGSVQVDVLELRANVSKPLELGELGRPLDGIDHPAADDLRMEIQNLLEKVAEQRRRIAREEKKILSTEDEGAMVWMADKLIETHPEVALSLLAQHGGDLSNKHSPEPVLKLMMKTVERVKEPSEERVKILSFAAQMARLLTKYQYSRKILEMAVEECRLIGREDFRVFMLSSLAFNAMECRDWDFAVEYAELSLEGSKKVEMPPISLGHVHVNYAGIAWHLLRFEEAVKHYEIAYHCHDTNKPSCTANVAFLWAVFGVEPFEPILPPQEELTASGYELVVMGYGQFSSALGHGDYSKAAQAAAMLLDFLASENMERILCVLLDGSAYLFGRMGLMEEAAATVRLGTKLRSWISHERSPAEKLAIRRNVGAAPYYSERTAALMEKWESSEANVVARNVARRLATI